MAVSKKRGGGFSPAPQPKKEKKMYSTKLYRIWLKLSKVNDKNSKSYHKLCEKFSILKEESKTVLIC